MVDKAEKEKRIREIQRRKVQIKIQMDRLRQAAFLDSKAVGGDRYHQQQAKKDLDRLMEENDALAEELEELTAKPKKKESGKSEKKEIKK
jgi:hypothetical protein